MSEERPNFIPRRRPGQNYTPPSQAELDAREDRARATDPNVEPKIDPRAAELLTPENEQYRQAASGLRAADEIINSTLEKFGIDASVNLNGNAMAYANQKFQDNLSKMQANLDEIAKEDRNLAFSVADALSDGVRENQDKVKVEVKAEAEEKTTNVTQMLADALGQDTLDGIKQMFSKQNFAFTDMSTGKTVEPSSNMMTADKIAEKAAPQTGQGV